jgi:succinoglycan biosynthesis protein ExoL
MQDFMLPHDHESTDDGAANRKRGRITYIAFDTNDPAVYRRLSMFQRGGAQVELAGFRRAAAGRDGSIDLGRTHSRRFGHRAFSVLKAIASVVIGRVDLGSPDAIVCRNLECLAVGLVHRALRSPRSRIVYEVLDIHGTLVSNGFGARAMRWLERVLAERCSLIITSSPGFVSCYFEKVNKIRQPIRIVENKVYTSEDFIYPVVQSRRMAQGWRVGWYGSLRCNRSLEVLSEAASRMKGNLRLVLAGNAAPTEIPDFDARKAKVPFLEFRGRYRNPDDLENLYSDVHFAWTIDFHEAETNSKWLLPNRLYEGGLYGTVPIARAGTQTAEWLHARGIGVILDTVDAASVEAFLSSMTPQRYLELQRRVAALPRSTWITSDEECQSLVDDIL